eukprot:11010598-Lingulodinium_polyedra.AAC.1
MESAWRGRFCFDASVRSRSVRSSIPSRCVCTPLRGGIRQCALRRRARACAAELRVSGARETMVRAWRARFCFVRACVHALPAYVR